MGASRRDRIFCGSPKPPPTHLVAPLSAGSAGARDARAGRACGGAASPVRDGYLFIVFRPDLFMPLDDDRRALAAEVAAIKATRQEGVEEIRIPGERAYRERARLTREGIETDRRIQNALGRLPEGKGWTD
ncbi:MAG TPA: Ldh family oxidoreductase [Candidatus Binatia bacterium]|nr:Ldh family oxidoreductase [Candidatus Binatia bacterium]